MSHSLEILLMYLTENYNNKLSVTTVLSFTAIAGNSVYLICTYFTIHVLFLCFHSDDHCSVLEAYHSIPSIAILHHTNNL